MRLQAFREGDVVPDGSRFVRSEIREIPGSEYEQIVAPRTLLSWIGITETVATMVKREVVNIYEVPE